MKRLLAGYLAILAIIAFCGLGVFYIPKAVSQSAVLTPVYIPSVALPLGTFSATVAAPTATSVFSIQNESSVWIRFTGTFTGLSAVVQVTEAAPSVAVPTWETVAVISQTEKAKIRNISLAGLYNTNVAGARQVRVLVNGVTITPPNTLTITLSGNFGDRVVQNAKVRERTFYSTASAVATASSATDVVTLTGNATTIAHVKEVTCYGTQTTSGPGVVFLIKRSTANSAGASTTPAVVPADSNNVAGASVVRAYTANPTTGSALGTVGIRSGTIGDGSTTVSTLFDWQFGADDDQDITLNGTSEVLAVNLNGVSYTGGALTCTLKWTEQ